MNYTELQELVKDNSEAVDFLKGVRETAETNVQTIGKLETKVSEANVTRDKYKQGNALIKSKLGLEHINDETINSYLDNQKGNKGDDALKLELENRNNIINDLNSKVSGLETANTNQVRDYNTKDMVNSYATHESVLPTAHEDVRLRINSMISYDENNKPVFKNADGTTKYINGKIATNDDIFAEIKTTSPHLFSKTTKDGGGSKNNNGGGSSATSKKDMSNSEKGAYIKEHGQDAYLQLK